MVPKLTNLENGQRTSSADSQSTAVSQSDAAEMLSVSTRTVATAAKVRSEAPDELVRTIEQGTVSLSLAAQAVALPEPEKQAIADAIAAEPETRRFTRILAESSYIRRYIVRKKDKRVSGP